MRIITTASKWGNLYNFRHYADGTRISKHEYARICATKETISSRMENTKYGFRTVEVRE